MHGPLHSLRRLVGTSSAAAAAPPPEIPEWLRDLPREVCLCTSTVPGLAYGICAAQRIQQGTWIGPFQGVLLLPEKVQTGGARNTQHLWEVSHSLKSKRELGFHFMSFMLVSFVFIVHPRWISVCALTVVTWNI